MKPRITSVCAVGHRVSLCLVVAILGCGEPPPLEPVGEAASSVQNGAYDTGSPPHFPAVVAITRIDGNSVKCSGTLIASRWVLSARHCFIDASLGIYDDFRIRVGSTLPGLIVKHTLAKSGPVLVRSTESVDPLDDDDISRDIALFRLDEAVPRTLVKPLHPPLIAGSCGTDMPAYLVGFGGGDMHVDTCPEPFPRVRRYGYDTGWDRSAEDYGSVYRNHWFVSSGAVWPDFCDQYFGQTAGDSGGALIDPYGKLCGVISSVTFHPVLVPVFEIINIEAAVDSQQTIDWIRTAKTPAGYGAIDASGNWEGECEALYACDSYYGGAQGVCPHSDADADGVHDLCDSCPRLYNPEQVVSNDDPDGDGIGAACDFCPDVGGHLDHPLASNCNYETELALAYPGQTAPPWVLAGPPPEDPLAYALFLTRLAKFRDSFQPDACDPLPCPRQDFLYESSTLPAADTPPIVDCVPGSGVPGCNCNSLPVLGGCEWTIYNEITLSPTEGSNGIYPAGSSVDVGLRWCDCDPPTASLTDRVRCQQQHGCDVDWELYYTYLDPQNPWLRIHTEASAGWPVKDYGAEYELTVLPQGSSAFDLVRWDFVDLIAAGHGWFHLYEGFVSGIRSQGVDGVLWAAIVNSWNGDVQERSHTYQAGNGSMLLDERNSATYLEASEHWPFKHFCPGCPEGFTRLLAKINDPLLYRATVTGAVAAPEQIGALRAIYEQMALGEQLVVPAAEPLGRIAAMTPPGEPLLRGVTIDDSLTVSSWVVTPALDEALSVQYRPVGIGSPVLHGDEAVVLSAALRRVLVLGGTADGTPDGPPEPAAWMLDIDANQWTEEPVGPEAQVGEVLGGTFRLEDLAAYLVDRRDGQLLLRRWRSGEGYVALASLPAAWGAFERCWLVAGQGGDLVFACSTAAGIAAEQSLLSRFVFDADGMLAFAGMANRPQALLAAPIAGFLGLSLVVPDPSGGRLEHLSYTEFGPAAGEQPQIFGWPPERVAADNSAWLMAASEVHGNVSIARGALGPVLADQAELVVESHAMVDGDVAADTVRLRAASAISGAASYNELLAHRTATIGAGEHSPLELPLMHGVPQAPAIATGGSPVTLTAGEELTLDAGSYGEVRLWPGSSAQPSTLRLGAGRHGLGSLTLGAHSRVECLGPCEIVVAGRLQLGARASLGPAVNGAAPQVVQLFVAGENGGAGGPADSPAAVLIGSRAKVRARVHVPAGTLRLRARAELQGAVVARDVWVGPHAVVAGGAP